jgi:hypothetical protein
LISLAGYFLVSGINLAYADNALQDPFAKGLKHSPQYGTLDSANYSVYSRPDDLRALKDARYYRVVSIFDKRADEYSSRNQPIPIVTSNAQGDHNGFFFDLSAAFSEKEAKQQAKDFLFNYSDFINRSVLIRKQTDNSKLIFIVEYGPYKTQELAKAACYFIGEVTKNTNQNCDSITKHRTNKDFESNNNGASIGLSQAGIREYMNIDMGFNGKSLSDYAWPVKEGEPLGPKNFYIVNINKYGIYLASSYGELALIPSSTLPINIEGNKEEVSIKDASKNAKDNSADSKDKNLLPKFINQNIQPADNSKKTGK